jgi:hypothetical protein
MGNITTSATLNVVINSPSIIPGVPVQGRVYLMVNHDRVEAETLMLRITGGEYTCVRYVSGNGEHRNHHSAHSTSIFLDLAFPLASSQDGYFRRGQYEFPFTFTLPTGVLPSMGATIPGDHGGHCSVTYTVEVKLHRRGWFKWDIKHHQELWVLGTPVQHIPSYSTYLPPVEYPLTFWCCYKVGNVRLGLSTANSLLAAGQTFDINYVIQNNSTSRVKAMEVVLLEVVIFRAQGRTASASNILWENRLTEQEMQVDLSPVSNPNDSVSIGGSPVITNQQIIQQLKEILDSRRYRSPASVPSSARTTMDGNLIDVEHYLKIRIATPFGTSDPEIATKLSVHRYGIQSTPYAVTSSIMPPMHQTPNQLPPNWHAQVAPPAQVPLPSYTQPQIFDSNEVPGPVDFTPMAPQLQYQGVPALFQVLSHTYDQPAEFQKWCSQNNADVLTPQDMGMLFKVLRKTFDQIAVADQLVTARTEITCAHLAATLNCCLLVVKIDIVKKLSVRCSDKENKAMIKDQMSPFEWMCVEECFAR